jgi:hypothetical protein
MNHKMLVQEAIRLLEPSIQKLLSEKAKRRDMHVVVMNPTLKPWDCPFEEAILMEYSFTDPTVWENPYDEMAREKARQAWRAGRSNVESHLLAPATLKDGDLAFYGSFEHLGVIVAASGVESWFDVLISGWIAVAFQQLAQAEYQDFKTKTPMARFIG